MDDEVLPRIDRAALAELGDRLGGRPGMDVTGGMRGKVLGMVALAEQMPGVQIRIFSGATPGAVQRALTEAGFDAGTMITAQPAH